MTNFTIFKNTKTGELAAIYDWQIPTPTGIGCNDWWVPIYKGKAKDFLDKNRQRRAFEKQHNCP